jgi:hypothetical protein
MRKRCWWAKRFYETTLQKTKDFPLEEKEQFAFKDSNIKGKCTIERILKQLFSI